MHRDGSQRRVLGVIAPTILLLAAAVTGPLMPRRAEAQSTQAAASVRTVTSSLTAASGETEASSETASAASPWTVFTPADSSLAAPPNHVANPGFELGEVGRAEHWSDFGSGYEIDETGGRDASRALKLVSRAESESHGAAQTIRLDQTEVRPLYFSAWSRAQGVSGEANSGYSVYIDIRYTDGTPLYGRTLNFDTGSHSWQHLEKFIMPAKPIESVYVYCLLRYGHTGTVWFDDLSLHEVAEGAEVLVFDGVQVATQHPDVPPFGHEATELLTGDGLGLELSSSGGAVLDVALGGTSVGDPERAYAAGFFVRDVLDQGDFMHVGGQVACEPPSGEASRCDQSGELPELGLAFSASFEATDDRISVHAVISDTTSMSRALTLYFALPMAARGWSWGQDMRATQVITGVRELANFRYRSSVGANGNMSRYPWSAIDGPPGGIALAVPLDSPRVMRLVHNPVTGQLYAAFDLALSPLTTKFPSRAWVDLLLYRLEVESGAYDSAGFRAAAQGYYHRFPQFFRRRLPPEDEGLWVAFSDLSPIPDIEDFGIRVHELGSLGHIAFDDSKGIYSFRYVVEPWSHWLAINDPEVDPEDYDQVMDYLRRRNDEGDRRSEATLSSGFFRPDGTFRFESTVKPWCHGVAGCAVFTVNPDPDIEDPDYPLNKGRYEWSDAERQTHLDYPDLDGEYIDSFSSRSFVLDYRASHFAASDTPLVYDTSPEHRLGVPEIFATTEFARWLTDDVHESLGKLTMANGGLMDMPWGADLFDFMGRETNWLRDSVFRPDSDQRLMYQRALSNQKPYGLLMNTDFDSFGQDMVERYMRTALFYGVYPSMFSHNAASDRYWDDPTLYERDRPLFKKYVPLIQSVNLAGWQPLTYARTSDERVYVERFGAWPDLYFTLRNSSAEEAVKLTLIIDVASLDVPGRWVKASTLLAGRELQVSSHGDQVTIEVRLDADSTEVLELQPRVLHVPVALR